MYKLIFSGELRTGFEREEVVTNLAQLLKQTPDTVAQRFFTGHPLVIKKVESLALAKQWYGAFAKAGAVLRVTTDAVKSEIADTVTTAKARSDVEVTASSNTDVRNDFDESKHEDDDFVQDTFMSKPYFAYLKMGAIALIFVLIGVLIWVTRPIWQQSDLGPEQEQLVSALASKELLALGHVDMAQLNTRLLAGADLASLPGVAKDLLGSLEQAGINVRTEITHLWGGAYLQEPQGQQKQPPQLLWVLDGQFTPKQFREWFKQRYHIEEETATGLSFSRIDAASCEKLPQETALISSSRIIVGPAAQVERLQARLKSGAGAVKDLTQWQSLSRRQMVSFAIFAPQESALAATAMNGVAGLLLQPVAADKGRLEQVSGLYLGLIPVAAPLGVEFSAVLASADKEFITTTEASMNETLAETQERIAQDWPEALALYKRVRLSQSTGQLRFALRFDENLSQELQSLVASFFSRSFSLPAGQEANGDEQLEESPHTFVELQAANFPPYEEVAQLNSAFRAQVTAGPFGVAMNSLELTEKGMELDLNVQAFNLPNLGEESAAIELRIKDVLDKSGNSLLVTSLCGPDELHEATPINLVYKGANFENGEAETYISITGSKKIILPKNVDLTSIGTIVGSLDYNLPLTFERIRVEAPFAGKVIEAQGVRLKFMSSAPNSLRYEYSGNTTALLQVNGLNTAGQVLATSGSTRSDVFFSSAKSASVNYRGNPAAVEIILARALEPSSYNFQLTQIEPANKEFLMEESSLGAFTTEQLTALKKAAAPQVTFNYREPNYVLPLGPSVVAVDSLDVDKHFGLSLNARVFVADSLLPLARKLGAAQLFIDEVVDNAGVAHPLAYSAGIAFEPLGYFVNGLFQPNEEQPWLSGDMQLRADVSDVDSISLARGHLRFNAAVDTYSFSIPFRFGMTWGGDKMQLALIRWEEGNLIFSAEGDLSDLVDIKALAADGTQISRPARLSHYFGRPRIALEVSQIPAKIEFTLAQSLQKMDYPFELRPTK